MNLWPTARQEVGAQADAFALLRLGMRPGSLFLVLSRSGLRGNSLLC